MKYKNAVAFWYNLKGNYDIVIFDNKRNLNKFVKQYKQMYKDCYIDNEISIHDFDYFTSILMQEFDDNIVDYVNEVFSREIDNNKYAKNILICEYLDYGF